MILQGMQRTLINLGSMVLAAGLVDTVNLAVRKKLA